MTSGVREIRIEHLSKDDVLDIEGRVGREDTQREEEPVPVGSKGEPITFALLLATAAALKAYVAHLQYKAAALPDETFTHTVTVVHEDGTKQTTEVRYEARSGEAFSDAAIRELSTLPGLDSALSEALA
jgi:hypothetical protein